MLNQGDSEILAVAGAAAVPVLTDGNDDLAELVRAALDELRPILHRDGGDMTLVAIEGDLVVIDLKGTCVGCALSQITVAGIRKKLIDAIGRNLRVVPLSVMPSGWRRRMAS